VRIIQPAERHWTVFRKILANGQAVANLVTDAHLAAGATLSLVVAKLQAEVFSAANTGASIGLSFGH